MTSYMDMSQVNAFAADLGKIGTKAQVLASAAIRKTAHDIEAEAKVFAPVDTGNLKNSISTSVSLGGLSAEIGPTAEYGIYVELGTSRMAPAAYMGPAFDRKAPDLETALSHIADGLVS